MIAYTTGVCGAMAGVQGRLKERERKKEISELFMRFPLTFDPRGKRGAGAVPAVMAF